MTPFKQKIGKATSKMNSMYPGKGGVDPVGRSVAEPDVALEHRAHGHHVEEGFANQLPKAARTPESTPQKEGPYPAPLAASESHGWGHNATQRHGHLRMSGMESHQIGKK